MQIEIGGHKSRGLSSGMCLPRDHLGGMELGEESCGSSEHPTGSSSGVLSTARQGKASASAVNVCNVLGHVDWTRFGAAGSQISGSTT